MARKPFPKIWTPEPPSNLRNLLEKALNEEDRSFERAVAMATLISRLREWFEEFVSYCQPLGGTYGLNSEAIEKLANVSPAEGLQVVIPSGDGTAEFRPASEDEKSRFYRDNEFPDSQQIPSEEVTHAPLANQDDA